MRTKPDPYSDLKVHKRPVNWPIWLLPLLLLALIAGMSGGWARMGHASELLPQGAAWHAILMIGGFLGSLITLERAMAMPNRAWLLMPALNALSVPVLLWIDVRMALGMQLLSSTALFALLLWHTRRHNNTPILVMSIGALCWMAGSVVMLLSLFTVMAVPWWIGFLTFTIVGERLDLSKFLPTPRWAIKALYLLVSLLLLSLLIPFHSSGFSLSGWAQLGIAVWLLYFDMARIIIKKQDRFKYIGTGLRVGYFWLLVHGLSQLLASAQPYYYDLYLHTFFLGFVFSMIWAHAPIILPLLLKLQSSPYHPWLWVVWAIFQLSLVGRLVATIMLEPEARLWLGMVNGWSILAMFGSMALITLWREKRISTAPLQHLSKKAVATFLLFALLLQLLQLPVIELQFQQNRVSIAASYCNNRNLPKLSCEGNCELNRRLKAAQTSSDQNSLPPELAVILIPFFIQAVDAIPKVFEKSCFFNFFTKPTPPHLSLNTPPPIALI
ncbi:MAG: hypothetical protein ACK417_03060 [Bacteroidia bacterium]